MKVIKITTEDDRVFYNAYHNPDLIAATIKRLVDFGYEWKSIERIEMTADEYHNIPATNEAAELWRTAPTAEKAEEWRISAMATSWGIKDIDFVNHENTWC